jgi:hypothetical protein
MATSYKLNTPDGQVLELNVPDGARIEDVQAAAQQVLRMATAPKVDQTVLDANDARAQQRPMRIGQMLARIPGVPESVTQAVDQWYARNGAELDAQEAQLSTGVTQHGLRGLTEMAVTGPVQLAANLPGVPEGVRNAVNGAVQADERRYQRNRQIAGQEGFDIARGFGNAAAIVAPSRVLSPFGQASWLARAGNAGVQGAVAGAAMPVVDGGNNYWSEKGAQVATGAIAGAALAPPLEMVIRGATGMINVGARTVQAIRERLTRATDQEIDAAIQQALDLYSPGIRLADMAADIQTSLRARVRQQGDLSNLQPREVARVADMSAVGVTPTRARATRDPVLWSQEENLRRMGANSDDPALQQLSRTRQADNAALIERINALGAEGATPEYAAGARILTALRQADEDASARIGVLYREARDMTGGRAAGIDLPSFQQRFNAALDAEQLQNFVPDRIRGILNRLRGSGMPQNPAADIPLTVDTAQQLDKILSIAQRATNDGNERAAIGIIRRELANAPIENGLGEQAMRAYTRARDAARRRFQWLEQNPALAAAVDGAQPDRFVREFIIEGSNTAAELAQLRRAITADPEAFSMIRQQIVAHLKNRALNQATDEAGIFSHTAFRKALNAIGEEKLRVFFSPQEIAQLRQLERAATWMQKAPAGDATNYSNSGALLAAQANNLFQRIAMNPAWNFIPGWGATRDAARAVAGAVAQTRSRDAVRQQAQQALSPLGTRAPVEVIDANVLARYLVAPGAVGGSFAVDPRTDR